MIIKPNKIVIRILFALSILFLYSPKLDLNAKNTKTLKKTFEGEKKYSLHHQKIFKNKNVLIANTSWEKIEGPNIDRDHKIYWEKYDKDIPYYKKANEKNLDIYNNSMNQALNSLNRSIVINNKVGPDISWLVPPGLKWNSKNKFDFSIRGHNRRKDGEPLLGWNGGDGVAQIYYQAINLNKSSFGINLGIRSIYQGSGGSGGSTSIGEGQSLGFRIDHELSDSSGIAFGAEQLLHFDGHITDTGRDIYLTATKGWWSKNKSSQFPLNLATFGFATGKMAEGNIKGLCSDLLGGSGTEEFHQRSLCWAPVFSLARVYNNKFSSFFEYNSKWFLLGTSLSPLSDIPLRGTFAIQLSDHRENYKLNNFDNLKWVFRLSYGF